MPRSVPNVSQKKIAICFFGITRSLIYTVESIEKNILGPAREIGSTQIFAHFFDLVDIANPRSGESGLLRRDEHTLLHTNWLQLEAPGNCLVERAFDDIAANGDSWGDEFKSLRNLVHQLHSLDQVTKAAFEWEPDIYIFCRPDLMYHDSLKSVLRKAVKGRDSIYLPSWQHWRKGYNDRFSICVGARAAIAYGRRITQALEYCESENRSLHSELLLRFALEGAGIEVEFISQRATRIRHDGSRREEEFTHFKLRRLLKRLRKIWNVLK